ncbi:MAG: DUF167 domain-containing protein [Fimbriimonadaceae bacterium]
MPSCSELRVRVSPRASRDRLEFRDGVLRVYTTAPPVDGEANKAVVALVAKRLGVAKSRVSVLRGESSRDKVLRIDGLSEDEVDARIKGEG